jgi:hypothetical protein
MADAVKLAHGVMEGGGSYNQNARLPAGGAALALPLLEQAARNVRIEESDRPFVIADYGSSQGKNSLAPLAIAIKALRSRLGADRPIRTYHVDQPSNDFNSLFLVLDGDAGRYTLEDPNVFPSAIGRSFYSQVLPRNSVDLAWSSYAAVWLSRVPGPIPGTFIALQRSCVPVPEFALQAAKDWELFLTLRARELRPGGRLVVVLPARDERRGTGFEPLIEHVNEVLADMVREGLIQAEERARMVLGSFPRTKTVLLVPFAANGQFEQLIVEDCELATLEDAAWAEYQRDKDQESLAAKHAVFFRSIFVPSLASALTRAGDPEACRAFSDHLHNRLKQRLAKQPLAMHSFVSTIVLAKRNTAQ